MIVGLAEQFLPFPAIGRTNHIEVLQALGVVRTVQDHTWWDKERVLQIHPPSGIPLRRRVKTVVVG
jgi:hypothetical protein